MPKKPASKQQFGSNRPVIDPVPESAASEPENLIDEPTNETIAAPEDAAVDQPTTDQAEAVAEALEVAANPVVHPDDHPSVSRLNVPRLALPKLSLPKFGLGRPKTDDDVDATLAAESHAVADTAAATDADMTAATVADAIVAVDDVAPQDPAPKTGSITVVSPKTGSIKVVNPKTASIPVVAAPVHAVEPTVDVTLAKPAEVARAESVPAEVVAVEPKKKVARSNSEVVLLVEGLTKRYDETVAVNGIDFEVKIGSFYGIVGPNGAGKTTTLSMITGLLRPDAGTVAIHGADVWSDPVVAKRNMGVLPDRLRLFDRLTGAQMLYYAGVLRGLDDGTVRKRTADLAGAFGLEEALGRLVSDYSAGMTKKVALAAAMIHSPRILVLDEPFESVDPVSAATITDILRNYAEAGGTVVLSSHSMDLVQRICDHVAVIVGGDLLADGTMAAVRDGRTLEERFVELAGGRKTVEGLEWLHSFSD